MPKIIVVDEKRCLSCKQCMIECAMAHVDAETLVEALRGARAPQSRVHVEPIGDHGIPIQCRHCQDAPCQAVCPTGAIHRESEQGPVLLDAERCIGCKFCLLACPFGVISVSRDGRAMVKCDQCIERLEAGQEPACVAGCPTGALKFVEMETWLASRRQEAARRSAEAMAGAEEAP